MKKIYSNKYQEIYYDSKVSLMKLIFKVETEKYTNTHLQKEALRFRDFVEEFKSDYLILDVTFYRYQVNEQELEWVASLFPNRYAKKVAVVCSDEALHAKLATNAILGMMSGLEGKVRFFDNNDAAMMWIGQDYMQQIK
ncbi:MAG: hypothetical protein SNJ77_02935 [Cytophagales bacterium]